MPYLTLRISLPSIAVLAGGRLDHSNPVRLCNDLMHLIRVVAGERRIQWLTSRMRCHCHCNSGIKVQ